MGFKLPIAEQGKNTEETLRNVLDAYNMMRKLVSNLLDGQITYENVNLPGITSNGIDASKLQSFNALKNSQFEDYNSSYIPYGYTINGTGTVSADAKNDGTVSFKLPQGEDNWIKNDKTLNKINPTYWKYKKTRLTFWKKFGKVRVEVISESILGDKILSITDENGDASNYIEFAHNDNWDENSRCTLTFTPPAGFDSIVIKISNADETNAAYIDCLHVHPDNTGYPVLYRDGGNSEGYHNAHAYFNTIYENTVGSGVTIDEKILIKDGDISNIATGEGVSIENEVTIRNGLGIQINNVVIKNDLIYGEEVTTEPDNPSENKFVIYAVNNGGKTQLKVKFQIGVAQVIATEP